ncbi:MAG: class I SAM-dependent methyltransferase [Candidatus Omnitrophica bacterium]|nr:class I SAM-dependent methyltransferase [Candidatus Omnitrophota bacterium]
MKSAIYKTIKECRICGSNNIKTFLELGNQPPANSLRSDPNEKLPLIPLSLCRCEKCTTIQLTETVDPEFLFKHYLWVSGTSSVTKAYANLFHKQALDQFYYKKFFVVEVASNDGTFLKKFKDDPSIRVLGVDPAENIAKIAIDNGIPTKVDFFGKKCANEIVKSEGTADFVFARNVIPHVSNVQDVIAGMKSCLDPEGVGAIEFHYAGEIVKGLQYDSIYHEHLFYLSLKSLFYLFQLYGLEPFDLVESPISGGSLVVYLAHKNNKRQIKKGLKQKISEEKLLALDKEETWINFSRNCLAHKNLFIEIINKYSVKGRIMIGYGASARSSTLLNFCKINKDHLVCIADQNPLKHDKFTAGTDIPIVSPEKAFSMKPGAIVLLAWNFRTEILELIKNKYNFKGTVIVPLPNKPEVITI